MARTVMVLLPLPLEDELLDDELETDDELLELLLEEALLVLDEELLELDEELLELLPSQTLITPPSPDWLLQVVIPTQLWLFSQPHPESWLMQSGRGSS
jgi:hypothetical protein